LPARMWVRGPGGGDVRGAPFHSQSPEAASFRTPGLKIVYPATARDAKGLIKASIRDDDPVIYLEHKWLYRRIKEQLPEGEDLLTPIGQARLAREGKDLSIVTYGATVWKALEAAEQLAKDDRLSVEVLDLRTLLPMDDAAIMRTVQKTNKVVIVHEDTRTGGIAGEIAARINEQAFEWLDGPIMRVTAHDVPLPYAPTLADFGLPQTEHTDKVDAEIPAPQAGVLAEIKVQEGQTVPVQTLVAVIETDKAAAKAPKAAAVMAPPVAAAQRAPAASGAAVASSPPAATAPSRPL